MNGENKLWERPRPGDLSSVIVLSDHGWINGGQAKIAIDSSLALRGYGYEVCFVAGSGPLDDRLLAAGVECHTVGDFDILSDPNRLRAARNGIWNAKAARVVSECIAARDPQSTIVHVHGWAKVLSPSIGPVVTRSRAAHVYTLHEYFLACPNGGFYDYRSNAICKRRALGVSCLGTRCDPRADHHKVWRVARQAVLWSAGCMPSKLRELIYLSPEQLEIMGSYFSEQAHWHYLPNPAGPRPDRRIVAEKKELFLFVGRLSPEKGGVIAAQAAAIAGVRIAFCGDGEEREAILRANPEALMLGWLPQEELLSWMRRARCLVFPSLWYETYGLVVAEALRLGLPVIVSRSSVAASLIEDNVSGKLAVAGDIQAWADAMSLLKSDKLVTAYSEGAFRLGKHLLGESEYLSRLIDIYRGAINRKQQQTRSRDLEALS